MKYQTTENVQSIPINEIQPFRNHPFTVADNEDMARIVESIGKVGTITPLLARPLPDGGYELISGHRRLEACRKLGFENIPVIIRDMTDDEAVIAMVDANLQREHILPSEKAFAYKMKLEAISHQGKACGQVVHKSRDTVSNTDSGRQMAKKSVCIQNECSALSPRKVAAPLYEWARTDDTSPRNTRTPPKTAEVRTAYRLTYGFRRLRRRRFARVANGL